MFYRGNISNLKMSYQSNYNPIWVSAPIYSVSPSAKSSSSSSSNSSKSNSPTASSPTATGYNNGYCTVNAYASYQLTCYANALG